MMKKIIQIILVVLVCLTSIIAKSQSYDTLGFVNRVDSSSVVGYFWVKGNSSPFASSDYWSFSIEDTSLTKVNLYDQNGNDIKTICNGLLKPGIYTFKLFNNNRVDICSGVYILLLEVNTNTDLPIKEIIKFTYNK